MDDILMAAGAQCVTGVLYLDREEMGRYLEGAFVPTAKGRLRAEALAAGVEDAAKAEPQKAPQHARFAEGGVQRAPTT